MFLETFICIFSHLTRNPVIYNFLDLEVLLLLRVTIHTSTNLFPIVIIDHTLLVANNILISKVFQYERQKLLHL